MGKTWDDRFAGKGGRGGGGMGDFKKWGVLFFSSFLEDCMKSKNSSCYINTNF